MKIYSVYILASNSRRLYVGVTSDLERRVAQHQLGELSGFAEKYQIRKLVYFEQTSDVRVAIAREKQIKRWRREKKLALIELVNPGWHDLARSLDSARDDRIKNA